VLNGIIPSTTKRDVAKAKKYKAGLACKSLCHG